MHERFIAHLEDHQAEFDQFYTEHKPVREYVEENDDEDGYLYWYLCSDLGIRPIESMPEEA